MSDGGNTWIFKIRKGVKFHSGKDLTANDVVSASLG
jgi:ABC-type transport system substrate-binding protein